MTINENISRFTTPEDLKNWVEKELNKHHFSDKSLRMSWDKLAYELLDGCYQHLLVDPYQKVGGQYQRITVTIDVKTVCRMLNAATDKWHELTVTGGDEGGCHAAN